MTSSIAFAFSLKSALDVSTLLLITEIWLAWWECVCVAIARRQRSGTGLFRFAAARTEFNIGDNEFEEAIESQ
jgi:hypothetical protein